MHEHPARLDNETLVEWIIDCLCVAQVAEWRRDWDLYRDAQAELRMLVAEFQQRIAAEIGLLDTRSMN